MNIEIGSILITDDGHVGLAVIGFEVGRLPRHFTAVGPRISAFHVSNANQRFVGIHHLQRRQK